MLDPIIHLGAGAAKPKIHDPLTADADAQERFARIAEACRLETKARASPFLQQRADLLAIAAHHRAMAARLAEPATRRAAA